MNFDFDADLVPAFQSGTDSDQTYQNNADPDPQHCLQKQNIFGSFQHAE
jgi:hypothetical protein